MNKVLLAAAKSPSPAAKNSIQTEVEWNGTALLESLPRLALPALWGLLFNFIHSFVYTTEMFYTVVG